MTTLSNRTARATHVYFDSGRIHVCLSDGREISAPLDWFPRLYHATALHVMHEAHNQPGKNEEITVGFM